MRQLCESPDLRKKMGLAGRDKAERQFTNQRTDEETISVYQEVLAHIATQI